MEPDDGLVTRSGGLVARPLRGPADGGRVLTLLDEAEAAGGIPLVDEAEHDRVRALAADRARPGPRWWPIVAERDGEAVGYAGLVLTASSSGEGTDAPPRSVTGDVAVARQLGGSDPALEVLLEGVEELAARHNTDRAEVWLRGARPDELAIAATAGYRVERRLAVLGRGLTDGVPADPPPAGVLVRAYEPDADDAAVVAVLAAAYEGTPEGGWDLDRFRARRDLDWFRPDDLLVAEAEGGALLGLHWLKRRTAGVGEVYNLAIHPAGQGRGLGEVLLTAGLAHLAATGCDQVLLWVDLANERAVELYTSRGFTTRWEDVALARDRDVAGEAQPGSDPRASR